MSLQKLMAGCNSITGRANNSDLMAGIMYVMERRSGVRVLDAYLTPHQINNPEKKWRIVYGWRAESGWNFRTISMNEITPVKHS